MAKRRSDWKKRFDGQNNEPIDGNHFDDNPYRNVDYLGSEQSICEIVDNSTNIDSLDDQSAHNTISGI